MANKIYYLHSDEVTATAIFSNNGRITIKAGSTVIPRDKINRFFMSTDEYALRVECESSGKIINNVLTAPITLCGVDSATMFCLGRTNISAFHWRDQNGDSLYKNKYAKKRSQKKKYKTEKRKNESFVDTSLFFA